MSWVYCFKNSFTGKFVLVNYLTLCYILASVLKCYWTTLSIFYTLIFWKKIWGKNFFCFFFPLISSFLYEASRRVVPYVWTVRQFCYDVPAFGLDARSSVGLLSGTLRLDGISDSSAWGILQGYITFPPAPYDTPHSTLGFWTFVCYFSLGFSRPIVLLCLISIPGMFLYLISCSFSVFMFKIVEL
jgi:hypothetical protein